MVQFSAHNFGVLESRKDRNIAVWSPSGATARGAGGLTVNREVVASTPLRISRFDEDKCSSSSRNYLSGQVCDGGVSCGCWRQYVGKGAGSNPACDHVTKVHPSGGREQDKLLFFFFNYTVLKMP